MYYGVDENGHIIADFSSDVLPSEYIDLYPDDARDLPVADLYGSDQEIVSQDPGSVSSGDPLSGFYPQQGVFTASANGVSGVISYDDFIDALAAVSSYNIYPPEAAVTCFVRTLNGVDRHVGYFVVSGPDTYSSYLYYSDNYSVSGSTITLSGDVTCAYYHQYRTTTSQPWQYTYTVSHPGTTSVTLGTNLVYTNLVEGYPDLIPYKSKESYTLLFMIPLLIVFLAISGYFAIRRNHV